MKEIIESIQKKLTGDEEKDTKFIIEQMEVYRDNKEVTDELYKILFSLLPQDLQNKFVSNVNQKMFEERIKEIQELVVDGQNERALKYLDRAIEKIDKVYEDEKNKYMTFHTPFEAYFYAIHRDKDDKKFITSATVDFGTYHKFRGIVLNNLKRFEEAEGEFVESLKWNPMDYEAIFEYAKCLFNLKKYEEFYNFNLETLKTAYTRRTTKREKSKPCPKSVRQRDRHMFLFRSAGCNACKSIKPKARFRFGNPLLHPVIPVREKCSTAHKK